MKKFKGKTIEEVSKETGQTIEFLKLQLEWIEYTFNYVFNEKTGDFEEKEKP